MAGRWSPALAGAAEIVGLVRRLADGQQRDDLVEQLDGIRHRLVVEPVPVVVIGGAAQGKSSVVNALVGAPVCAVGERNTTAAPTAVVHAADYRGDVVVDADRAGLPGSRGRDLTFGEAASLASTAVNPDNSWRLRLVELGVPSPTLARGLVLIDTPPIDEVWTAATTRVLQVVAGAAATVLVTSAASPLTPGELDLLRAAGALCPRVIVAVNGTNAFPGWASVVDRDRILLERRGVSSAVVAVAATPYWGSAGGVPPGPDPGMQQLAALLENEVVLDAEHQRISRNLMEAFWAADRLRMRLTTERSLTGDGDGIESAAGRLRLAASDAQELCSPTAAWHRELVAGLSRLRRDVADDLDAEMAQLRATAAALLDDLGRGAEWEQVHTALHGKLADTVVHVHRVRKLATRAFCKAVGDRFQRDWADIVASLETASGAHARVTPRLDQPSFAGVAGFADLPLATDDPAPAPAVAVPVVTVGAVDPGAAARATFDRWLRVVEEFLRHDTDELLTRVADELDARCQARGMELHRSIVEVLTTLTLLQDLSPDMVLQRHEALENDLEQFRSLDLQLGAGHRAIADTA